MQTPEFFVAVPRLRLRDPLAGFLGAAVDGVLEYGYLDAVKLAGHSCPTVAAAYALTRRALQALYGDQLPERGGIRVEFRDPRTAGVTGVIANVIGLLTGAGDGTAFKGIAGQFDRRGLMVFDVELPLEIRFSRVDTDVAVDALADLRRVPAAPGLAELMQVCLGGHPATDELRRFGEGSAAGQWLGRPFALARCPAKIQYGSRSSRQCVGLLHPPVRWSISFSGDAQGWQSGQAQSASWRGCPVPGPVRRDRTGDGRSRCRRRIWQ